MYFSLTFSILLMHSLNTLVSCVYIYYIYPSCLWLFPALGGAGIQLYADTGFVWATLQTPQVNITFIHPILDLNWHFCSSFRYTVSLLIIFTACRSFVFTTCFWCLLYLQVRIRQTRRLHVYQKEGKNCGPFQRSHSNQTKKRVFFM